MGQQVLPSDQRGAAVVGGVRGIVSALRAASGAETAGVSPRVVVDKYPRIIGVSDPTGDRESYQCYFASPQHPKEDLPEDRWLDGELGRYLVQAAAVLRVRAGTPTCSVEAECVELFKDATGEWQVTLRTLPAGEEVVLPLQGYRSIRAYLTPTAVKQQAVRRPERVFKNACTPAQWGMVERHRAQLARTLELQREGAHLQH